MAKKISELLADKKVSEVRTGRTSPLVDTKKAADFLGTQPGTLEIWRHTRRVKLPYVKIGRLVRYRQSDLEQFLDKNTVGEAL